MAMSPAKPRSPTVADRPIYDHAQKVQAAVEDAHDGGPTRAELIEQNQHLRQENAQLWDWLAQTIEFPPSKQREFSVTAAAMGLSLNQVLVLLALILGKQACPGRSTLHRWIKAAGLAAGRVLKSLDARCRALVLVGCLDEIFFHGRPVLVGVEPASMAWFLGQKANDRSGATWAKALRDWTALSFVTADAGTGLQAGIAAVQQERQEDGQAGVGERPGCVPHDPGGAAGLAPELEPRGTTLGAGRSGRPAGSSRRSGRARMPGARRSRRVVPGRRPRRPSRSTSDPKRAGRWPMVALAVFRPEGHLNDRAWAEQQIALALPLLSGREWSKVRGFLQAQETLTFLDRLHRQLREAVPEDAVACGVGAVVVAASAAAPSEHPGSRCGCGPCGASGATGGLPEAGRELAEVVRGRGAGVASDGARQQCGGVHEQRAADAPVAAQDGDAGLAGPEAPVLELSRASARGSGVVVAPTSTWG